MKYTQSRSSSQSTSSRVTAETLRRIADMLDTLGSVGIDITEFHCGNVLVKVARTDSQRDGMTYYATDLIIGDNTPHGDDDTK